MPQTAPGRYEAAVDVPLEGDYLLQVSLAHDGQRAFQHTSGLSVGYPEEHRLRPTDTETLRAIAHDTGGAFDPAPETVFRPGDRPAPRRTPLWPWLLLAALILFVLDVALRRAALPGWLMPKGKV
jgi:hypothetical protein